MKKIIIVLMWIIFNILIFGFFIYVLDTSGKNPFLKEIFALNYQIKYKNYYLNQTLFSCENNIIMLNLSNYKIITDNEKNENCNYYSAIIKLEGDKIEQ